MFEEGSGRSRLPRDRLSAGILASVVIHAGVLAFAFSTSSRPTPSVPAPTELTFFTALPAPPPPASPRDDLTVAARASTEPKLQPRKKPPARVPVPDLHPEVPEPEAVGEAPSVPSPSPEPPGGNAGGEPEGAASGHPGGAPGGAGTQRGETGTLAFAEGMTRPRLLSGREISYTREAIEAQVEGLMIVQCIIGVDGRLSRCAVVKSVPHMESPVLDALQTWRMEPVTLRGAPVAVKYNFPIRLVVPRR